MARYSVDGPGVLVPARVCALLERHLRLDRVRAEVRGADEQLDEVLSDLRVVAQSYLTTGSVRGTPVAERAERPSESPIADAMTASQVADITGVTPHAVRLARRRGHLRGVQVNGRWMFPRDEVRRWQQRTAQRTAP
jgi:hypothetical protein